MREKTKKEEEFIVLLGKRIRSLRKAQGYTNADFFAYKYEIDRSQYGKYERGLDMTFSSLLRLTEAFNISIQEFFAEGFNNSAIDNSRFLESKSK